MKALGSLSLVSLLALMAMASATPAPRAQNGQAQNAIATGEFVVDPPTLINLGFEWLTDGFSGSAPDLGALELNSAPPHDGPRP